MSQQAASLPAMLGQSMPVFSQASTLQDMSGVPRNTMNEGFTQGNLQDIYAAQIRKLILQQQQIMLMQQHIQQQQKPPMQQHIQQQSLLHPTPVISTQQPMTLQKFSGLLLGQCTVPYFPTKQPIIVSRQQQQQSIGQQSILQHGSVSGAMQQESTLPIKLQSYPHWTSTMQPNNSNCSLEPLLRPKQEELIRMNEDMQRSQRLLLEKQLQHKAQQQSQKLQQAPMQVTHHLSENDVNELKVKCFIAMYLFSHGRSLSDTSRCVVDV
ncbi:uncharacterized protein [Miscanthus floridulus]|uniref:uncharacterized protein n=1 Tax=Miscanthus floridulus TaxID=154761 RepID=UPI00345A97D1